MHYIIKYRDRRYIDKYRCIDGVCEIFATDYFIVGGLHYFKLDRFNTRVVETEKIIEIKVVE